MGEQAAHCGLARGIEVLEGLVEQQQRRPVEQRPGPAQALAHARGERAGRALAGELEEDQRPLLTARLHQRSGQVAQSFAVNDVVMQKHDTGRTLDFETRIDGTYVNTHDADGIIVASPTGSTAYALSCSGPIIEPHLPALVIVPICAHTLSDRPIVVAAGSVVEVALLERADTQANVTCDGALLGKMDCDDRLEVTTAAEQVRLLHPKGHDYYRLLRSKLHWGRGSFER